MPSVVFDASALICLVRQEPGWERVAAFGVTAEVSAVNLVEVVYRLRYHGMPVEAVDAAVRPVIGRIVPFDDELAFAAAAIHATTRDYGLSLADCACLALGLSRQATVVTADRKWGSMSLGIDIVQIR